MTKKHKNVRELKEVKEKEFGNNLRIAKTKNDYIRNLVNARYYMARCNMLAVQINTGKILENIDGCPKPLEFMRAEYAMTKMQAINSQRNVHFMKKDLIDTCDLTIEQIDLLEKDYYDGKIIRESYDESYEQKTKAQFIKEK